MCGGWITHTRKIRFMSDALWKGRLNTASVRKRGKEFLTGKFEKLESGKTWKVGELKYPYTQVKQLKNDKFHHALPF